MCFVGRANKPLWTRAFESCPLRGDSRTRIAAKIKAQIEACARREAENRESRAARNAGHQRERGTILRASWGSSCKMVDFFEVVDVPSKCFVGLVRIGAQSAGRSSECASPLAQLVVPNRAARGAEVIRRKAAGRTAKIDRAVIAQVWDGKPVYTSRYD